MFEHDFLAVCDGGSQGDGAAKRGYGSYHLATRDGRKQTARLDLGTATDNEADYRTLIAAPKDLLGRIQKAGRSPASYSLLACSDSQLIVGQVTQGWQVKAANLRSLIDEAWSLLKAFGQADLVKVLRRNRPHPGALAHPRARSPGRDRALFFRRAGAPVARSALAAGSSSLRSGSK